MEQAHQIFFTSLSDNPLCKKCALATFPSRKPLFCSSKTPKNSSASAFSPIVTSHCDLELELGPAIDIFAKDAETGERGDGVVGGVMLFVNGEASK